MTLAKVVRNFILGGPLHWGLQEGREVRLNSEYNVESGDLWPRSKGEASGWKLQTANTEVRGCG